MLRAGLVIEVGYTARVSGSSPVSVCRVPIARRRLRTCSACASASAARLANTGATNSVAALNPRRRLEYRLSIAVPPRVPGNSQTSMLHTPTATARESRPAPFGTRVIDTDDAVDLPDLGQRALAELVPGAVARGGDGAGGGKVFHVLPTPLHRDPGVLGARH